MKLKKTNSEKKTSKPEYRFFGVLKNDGHTIFKKGAIIEIGITQSQFEDIKKIGKKSDIVLVTCEGHGHYEYWTLGEFTKWTIEETVTIEKTTTYKGS